MFKLPKWFQNRLHTIMKHNDYSEDMITVHKCNVHDVWTPVDLILREYYNNGCGSAKGFLGITPKQCLECYEYIKAHQTDLKEGDFYNEKGISNWGFTLWTNYEVH